MSPDSNSSSPRHHDHFVQTIGDIPCQRVIERRFFGTELLTEVQEFYAQDHRQNVWLLETRFVTGEFALVDSVWAPLLNTSDSFLVFPGQLKQTSYFRAPWRESTLETRVSELDTQIDIRLGRLEGCVVLQSTEAQSGQTLIRHFAPLLGEVQRSGDLLPATREAIEWRDDKNPAISPQEFSPEIRHPYLSMPPGYSWHYEFTDLQDVLSVVVSPQKETETIEGVSCLVIHEDTFEAGRLLRERKFYLAQETRGAVWQFGSETRERINGSWKRSISSWRSGEDGAQPGVLMPAFPRMDDSFRQGYSPKVAEPLSYVSAIDRTVQITLGEFTQCLEFISTDAVSSDSPTRSHLYAPGIGLVLRLDDVGFGRLELKRIQGPP